MHPNLPVNPTGKLDMGIPLDGMLPLADMPPIGMPPLVGMLPIGGKPLGGEPTPCMPVIPFKPFI